MENILLRRQAYKFRLKISQESEQILKQYVGNARFVYNNSLALKSQAYSLAKISIGKFDLIKDIVFMKERYPFLKISSADTLQQSVLDMDKAYQNFFKYGAKYPRFKKKGDKDSIRFPTDVKVDQVNSRVFLPKLKWLRYFNSRKVEGKIKNATVSYKAGHWYVSLQTEREVEKSEHPKTSAIGIDLGISRFATCSDGQCYNPINIGRKSQEKIARLQRKLSKKKRYSKNYLKIKNKIARAYHKIGNIRGDYLHKISNDLSNNHATIVMEDLKIGNMSKSAKGSLENPGKNVKVKSGLNRSILDQGWGEFRRQIEYKLDWKGGRLILVPPQYTSQKCSACGYTCAENRKSQSSFACLSCFMEMNADLNASKNILGAGQALLACGESSLELSVKQEPAERVGELALA